MPGLRYLGCAPFDFAAFEGYRHQATSATAGLRGDTAAAALEVGTRCLTYAWRKAEGTEAAGSEAEGSTPGEAGARPDAQKVAAKGKQRAGSGGPPHGAAAAAKPGATGEGGKQDPGSPNPMGTAFTHYDETSWDWNSEGWWWRTTSTTRGVSHGW